ncbi:DUF1648 domain-containing protein [Plantactinospora sp. CA-290183]|uniref:DUF1648 domain-containing protein n=1 Tax=Plantactinospora sp. CA-290183 TaxID=3240006 RepID=UPI003D91F578
MTLLITADLTVIALVTCLALATTWLTPPTLPFGVRVTAARVADPAVLAQRRQFRHGTIAAAALAGTVSIPLLLGSAGSAVIGSTATALGVVDLLLYHRAYRQVRAAKLSGGWRSEHRQGITVDTSFRTDPIRLPWHWLAPPTVIAFVSATIGWWRYDSLGTTLPQFQGYGLDAAERQPTSYLNAFEPVLLQTGITLAVPLLVLLVLRSRPDLDAARPVGSARRYRVYLGGVARLLLLGAACLNLGLLVTALQLWGVVATSTAWRVGTYLPLAALVVILLIWQHRVGHAGHRLPAQPGEPEEDSGVVQRDDDRHWMLAGTVYLNRRDPAVFVHTRIGTRWTLNLGHPIAWLVVTAVLTVGLLAAVGVIDLPRRETLN